MSSDCANDEASKWLLDGGCSNHMTVKKNIFIDMEIIGNSYVRLGNCSLVEVRKRDCWHSNQERVKSCFKMSCLYLT